MMPNDTKKGRESAQERSAVNVKRILSLFLVLLLCAIPLAPTAGAAGTKLIAITYDDGPSLYTSALLDGLKERGAKATFFMVGTNVARYPATVARVYQEGHQVANHSYSHPQLTTLSYAGVQEQIQSVNALLDKACGAGTHYMVRAPYGSINTTVSQAVGAPLIQWSVDPMDWKYRNAETVKNSIIRQAHDGAIILVHDIHATSVPGSLAAIDYLQAQGYAFVTVQELFRRRGVTPQNGARYSQVSPNGTDLGPVDAPVITSQPEGAQLRISITAQEGAAIYYALGDGVLNQESQRYTEPFLVSTPCTLRAAAAFDMNGSRSEMVEMVFATPVTAAPEIRVKDGLLSIGCATLDAEIFFTLQGAAPQLYTGPVPIDPATEIEAWAQYPDYLPSQTVRASYSPRENLFRDVFPGQWYYEAMDRAVSAGYMKGMGKGCYAPGGELQRGQLLVMLCHYSGETAALETDLPFTDVPLDAYYAGAVAWAYEKGIVGGAGGRTFAPSRTVTRQEMAKILYGYLRTLDTALPDGTGAAGRYADREEIAPWAYEAVEQLTAIGLLSGDSGSAFHPAAGASRAQAALVLTRLADYMDAQTETGSLDSAEFAIVH